MNRRSRILIIDAYDERDMYAEAFRVGGHAVITATTAGEGLALMEANRPDIIVQGMAFPDMSGLELVARIKSRAGAVPVIAITGFTDPANRRSIDAAGFAAVVTKPCLPGDLLSQIESVMAARSVSNLDPTPNLQRSDS